MYTFFLSLSLLAFSNVISETNNTQFPLPFAGHTVADCNLEKSFESDTTVKTTANAAFPIGTSFTNFTRY